MEVEILDQLIKEAIEARTMAYAPYSKYLVGAAILTKEGIIIQGCNVENASYGLSNCAERTALFSAITKGFRQFESIVIVTQDGGFPCGACRQVLNEFNPKIQILIANPKGELLDKITLDQLLPHAFRSDNL